MKLHGSTEGNLIAAIRSAGRLRGKPVHADTIRYWADLIRHARQELTAGSGRACCRPGIRSFSTALTQSSAQPRSVWTG
jgi:hypothetical protein